MKMNDQISNLALCRISQRWFFLEFTGRLNKRTHAVRVDGLVTSNAVGQLPLILVH